MAGVGAASANTKWRDPMARREIGGKLAEGLAKEAGIAADDDACAWGLLRVNVKRAMPVTARRTLAKVNSSATMARQPEVPNLIGWA